MTGDELMFFNEHPAVLPLYERLAAEILARVPGAKVKVSKTQIGFSVRRGFAWVSFLPVRRAKDRPAEWITVTFGLGHREPSPRIDAATEPYPNRWTHHVMVTAPEQIDEELLGWIEAAAAFSAAKR